MQHLGDFDEPIYEQINPQLIQTDSNWRKLTYREQNMTENLEYSTELINQETNSEYIQYNNKGEDSILSLFGQNKFKEVAEVYIRSKDSDEYLNSLPKATLSMITGSLFLLVIFNSLSFRVE